MKTGIYKPLLFIKWAFWRQVKLRDSLFGIYPHRKKPPSKVLRLIPLFKKRWYQECLKMCVSSKISLKTTRASKW